MKNKKGLIFGMFLLFAVLIIALQVHSASAAGEVSYCCEKTLATNSQPSAWCQNVPSQSQCDPNYRNVPTSCDATSYCKLGTCVNNQEGSCIQNTPKQLCQPDAGSSLGKWYDSDPSNIPQCKLGCCLIGDQAAFTTQTRCKQLSSLYGLNTSYRTDIQDETQCIASAQPQEKGACVFQKDFQTTCKLTTRSNCQTMQTTDNSTTFYAGFLCSNENLGTNCGMSKKTMLIQGKDEVYFQDTCGNPANIYDASKAEDQNYWNTIVSKSQSCTLSYNQNTGNPSNANICGNCNYLSGSIGGKYDGLVDSVGPQIGDYICKNLNCNTGILAQDFKKVFGRTPLQGETWCASSVPDGNSVGASRVVADTNGNVQIKGQNVPGSRDFRLVCYNGQVTIEPCADFRQETCVQSQISTVRNNQQNITFNTAACRVNKWQDCTSQTTAEDCENTQQRDCTWLGGDSIKCVPSNPPGFDFWTNGSATSICVQANSNQVAKFQKDILGAIQKTGYKCVSGCEYVGLHNGDTLDMINPDDLIQGNTNSWAISQGNICSSLGDCGVSLNYIGSGGKLKTNDLLKVSSG